MAKFSKLPHTLSTSHALKCFDLIHMDIWRPYKVPCQNKYRFFLTLVDDHSPHTLLYLLQNKSEALSHLQKILEYAKTHFDKTIKSIRSDNALEFTSAACHQFYHKNGILHHTSCVNRTQQNARA